ncbi:hypothetical protein FOZ62_004797, partial [Perkinsus olseni]
MSITTTTSSSFVNNNSSIDTLQTPLLQQSCKNPDYMQAGAVIVKVGGMTCSSCVSTVENAVNALPFVDSCSVNLVTTKAEVKIHAAAVDLQPGSEPVEEIVDTIESVGFEAEVVGITKFEAKEATETAVLS